MAIDKSTWGEGSWQHEPDRLAFTYQGYQCLVLRGPVGSLCGYVGLDSGHPLHGIGYGDIEEDFEVHGGCTFSGVFNDEGSWWWVGFDCAHSGDVSPGLDADLRALRPSATSPFLSGSDDTYKDIEYVKDEIRGMVTQLRVLRTAAGRAAMRLGGFAAGKEVDKCQS